MADSAPAGDGGTRAEAATAGAGASGPAQAAAEDAAEEHPVTGEHPRAEQAGAADEEARPAADGGEDPAEQAAAAGDGEAGGFSWDVSRWTAAWTSALWRTGHVAMTRAEAATLVGGLVADLAVILAGDPFTPEAAREVGAALVGAHFVGEAALATGVRALHEHAAAGCEERLRGTVRRRVGAVQAAMTTGYVKAFRERTVTQQEAIRRAENVARSQADAALRAERDRLEAAVARASIGVVVVEADGHIAEVNASFAQLIGRDAEECRLAKLADFLHPQDAAEVEQEIARLAESGGPTFRRVARCRHRRGHLVRATVTGAPAPAADGRAGVLLLMEDASAVEALQHMLAGARYDDRLTYLPGRATFRAQLAALCGEAPNPQRVALCLVDLDGFAAVNASIGFDAGDRLLRAVAERLHTPMAADGHFVGRVDGDVFAVLFRPASAGHARRVAEAVHVALQAPFAVPGRRLRIGAAVGLAETSPGLLGADALLTAAETALSAAKAGGAGTTEVFQADDDVDDQPTRRLRPLPDLPAAIARGEVFLLYSPVVALTDHAIRGVEVQARWDHADLGVAGPDEFLPPLADGDPAVAATLRRWVLVTACHQAERWRRLRPATPLFVAVPLVIGGTPIRAAEVVFALTASGLPAPLLHLRVPESGLAGHGEQLLIDLHNLPRHGVRLDLTGVGTDRIDVAALRDLPLYGLTLAAGSAVPERPWHPVPTPLPAPAHQPLPAAPVPPPRPPSGARPPGAATRARPDPVLASIIHLGHGLGLRVTADELISADQARQLHTLGCDLAQGPYFAEPGPPSAITVRLVGDPRHR